MEVTTLWRKRFPIHGAIRSAMLVEIDRTETAVLVRSKPLLTARICRFQRIQMRNGVAAIGGIQEQHARLAVVMRLLDDLIEQLTRAHLLMGIDLDTPAFSICSSVPLTSRYLGSCTSGKRSSQSCIVSARRA